MSTLQYLIREKLHSAPILKLFEGDVFYNGAPVFDVPLVVMLFCNRSGSNLAAQYLLNTGLVGGLQESTNHASVAFAKKKYNASSYGELFEAQARDVIDRGRWYGIKASPNQLAMLKKWGLLSLFPSVKILNSTRKDVVGQAVSLSIAMQTQKWTSQADVPDVEVGYDFQDITGHINRICTQAAASHMVAAALSTPMHELVYEDVVEDPIGAIRGAVRFMGFPDGDLDIGEPKIQKQADEKNDLFIKMYGEELLGRIVKSV
ncbi:Stf0 family sulfotransferase [Acuticoccus sediminis]|nr:Stf0 family sulfotransferase [Acuticoccus sediminis]